MSTKLVIAFLLVHITCGLAGPNVHLSHQTLRSNAWAVTPVLIDILNKLIKPQTRWLVLCEANSMVNVEKLLEKLSGEDDSEELFLGFPLVDRAATIIHHFAFHNNPTSFHYPFIRAGVAFSLPLLHRMIDAHQIPLSSSPSKPQPHIEFSIDASHELALFLWNVDERLKLKTVPYFCSQPGSSECAIYARDEDIHCGHPISLDKVLFAVKTCAKYHSQRLPTILRTWAQFTIHLRMFSDVEDSSIPTISTHISNTERGHCTKSLKILRMVLDEITRNSTLKNVEWIVMADDDTILSTSHLSEYLGCFDRNDYIYLGERYGFDLFADDGGSNYITGGGGIVFNLKTLRKIVESCTCPSPSSPDDMIIAACLKQHDIEPIHSTLFHQARPKDYPSETLSRNSISFHKFWQIDPIVEYGKWFRRKDEEYFRINKHLLADYSYLKRECMTEQPTDEQQQQQQLERKIKSNIDEINRVEL